MTAAISPSASAASAAGIQAQIQRYEKVLSECENCSSAKTSAGKANIEDLNGKISVERSALAKLDLAAPAEKTQSPSAVTAAAPASGPELNVNRPGPQSGNYISTSGSIIDIST